MELLTLDDFKDTRFDPSWSRFDCLLQVAKVGKQKMQRQNFKIRIGQEKMKSHDFGYLKKKYFPYNAPQPQTLSKQQNMGFNNNVGLLQKKRKLKNEEDGEWEELTLKVKKSKKEKPAAAVCPIPPPQTLSKQQRMGFNNNVGLLQKKRKPKNEEDGEWEGLKLKVKKSKKEKPAAAVCPNPPPDLPDNFKQHIVEKMGGSGWVLIIQKPIFFSDINTEASRLSIPFSQLKVKTHEFLYKAEAEDLDAKKAIKVCLLEPSMKETTVNFNRWNMETSSSYVLTTKWNSVVKNNRLKIGDIVQLWSFRVNSKLCFALVKLQIPTGN